ncbi:hypothetical protein JXQ31_07355 [candidate division KSB1 bacterium]|nr:hypothetical protein [candidate division KSB1 bacterium]
MAEKTKSGSKYIFLPVFILFIIILSSGFHYPVHIADALTSAPVQDFTVHISPWRVVFEPFIGWMLFYIRADLPVVEFLVLLVWVMIVLLKLFLWKYIRNKNGTLLSAIGKGLKSWLAALPLLLTLFISLMIIFIFAPLPSNTIVNKSNDSILVNIHSHSYYSHDGIISPERLIKWHRRNGYEAFFLTEHNHHRKTLEIVRAQQSGEFPSTPLILPGQEMSGTNHILLLGLNRDFRTKDMSDAEAIDSTHAQNGIAVVAHWFADKGRPLQHYIDSGADGFEIANQAEGIQVEKKDLNDIVTNCLKNELLMLVSCDYHGYGSAAFAWSAFYMPGWHDMNSSQKTETILNILRQKDQSKIRLLLYRDRHIYPRNLVLLSPVYTLTGYFRSLNPPQVISWIAWIILIWAFTKIPRSALSRVLQNPASFWGIVGILGACLIVLTGILFLVNAAPLAGYNKIFKEYGDYFFWSGFVFLVYSLLFTRHAFLNKK